MCARGLYCKAVSVGEGGRSYTGVCNTGPDITEVYGKPCTLGRDIPECVYNNPLALGPRTSSALRCTRAFPTDTAGTCRIGPNKHGDGCNQNGECASGVCLKELKVCKGIEEGETCEPDFPDPCQPGMYCRPEALGVVGTCSKVSTASKSCVSSEGCARGFYCAGLTPSGPKKCVAPFSTPDGSNITIGPWMCASANAVVVSQGLSEIDSIYQCRAVNDTTLVNKPCNSRLAPPLGYECACSTTGGYRLRTVRSLGLGARVTVWNNLFNCLNTATSIMGELCEYDSVDLYNVRYGSCAYYACYPQYLKLVNVTGSLVFNDPFKQFQDFAECEIDAAKTYYTAVAGTQCISLPGMDNWRCAAEAESRSLSIADTGGVIAFITIVLVFGYVGHMYLFRKENGEKFPFVKD